MVSFITLASLFLASFAAATLLPGSSEAALAYLASQHPAAVPALFVTALAGNTLGALFNYAAGFAFMRYAGSRWFPASASWIATASRWFNHYGVWVLLLSWLPIIGDPLTVAAGVLRVRLVWFIPLVAIGKGLRYIAVLAGVKWLGG